MDIVNNGSYGHVNVAENNVMTFQVGGSSIRDIRPFVGLMGDELNPVFRAGDYNVLCRGGDNRQTKEIAGNIKSNRLLPELIEKQVKIMYGRGLYVYQDLISDDNKVVRKWCDNEQIMDWLQSWGGCGLNEDYEDFAQACIRRFYYFEDFFVKWSFTRGARVGLLPIAGLELIENDKARLATAKRESVSSAYVYSDFTHVAVADWLSPRNIKIHPRLDLRKIRTYNSAVSHHANDSVGSIYGMNKSYNGLKDWLLSANENPKFIRSFLSNSLAAKVHVIIPSEWVASKRQTIVSMCRENLKREKEGKALQTFNGIDIGTTFSEATLTKYTNKELERLTTYLSGAENQGKMFSSFSFQRDKGEDVRWKIEQVDLKYKEYIESLIAIDRRADEVLVSGMGIDPSISNVSKEGVISKSGSDAYYNYLIYQDQLYAAEKICCDPLNMAISVNFPELHKKGFRLGFFRPVPERQQDTSPKNRITHND